MYDFSPTPEQRELLDKAKRFMDEHIYEMEQYLVPHRGLPDSSRWVHGAQVNGWIQR